MGSSKVPTGKFHQLSLRIFHCHFFCSKDRCEYFAITNHCRPPEFWDMQTSRMPTPVQWLDERARHVMSSRPLDGKDSGTPTETKVFVLHQNWFKGNSVRKPLCLDERHRSTSYLGFISPWKTPPAWSLCANCCRSATPSACLQVDCSEWSEWSANTYERLVISTE
jgi:hypothetical protein